MTNSATILSAILSMAVVLTGPGCATDCPTIACEGGVIIEILDVDARPLSAGVYTLDVDLDPAEIEHFQAECVVPPNAEGNMCSGEPVIPHTFAYVIGDTESAAGIVLSVAPPFSGGEGPRDITVEVRSPSGISHARVFTVDFRIREPGGPDCEPCWSASQESWRPPLAD